MSNPGKADDVHVCRCGEVTRGEALDAIREGAHTVDAVKRMTRAGMGICQGRTCARTVAQLIQEETGLPFEQIGLPRSRVPVRPVPADILSSIVPRRSG